jgi:DeoR/GlpR family transcriptional regulator of sugar metabolism
MKTNERRMEIIEILYQRRFESMTKLALEFGVTTRTIRNDILELTHSYPIVTIPGRHGGVKVMDGCYRDRKYLNTEEKDLLESLKVGLSGTKLNTMNNILKKFALKK